MSAEDENIFYQFPVFVHEKRVGTATIFKNGRFQIESFVSHSLMWELAITQKLGLINGIIILPNSVPGTVPPPDFNELIEKTD
jgi:hypothetical protein